jgi:acyl-CoA thioesterase II
MSKALDSLVELLDLEQIDLDIFRGRSPSDWRQRVFGGQVAGQALVAAGRTVPADRPVHSLHAYFIRPGDPASPLVYTVDRVRDGRSFTTRRVAAIQHGKTIFTLSASFHRGEPGLEHAAAKPDVPPAGSIPPPDPDVYTGNAIDLRFVTPRSLEAANGPGAAIKHSLVWLRANGELPDDPLLHVCLMTYASDLTLLDSVLRQHGMNWVDGRISGASLDHAMWFHRPFRADRWLLYDQESPSASGARGLARGLVFTEQGDLVVSVVQEGLIRQLSLSRYQALSGRMPGLASPARLPAWPARPAAQPGRIAALAPSCPGPGRPPAERGQKKSCPSRGRLRRLLPCSWARPRRLEGRGCPVNNNVTFVPVTARPWTGTSAASLGAGFLSGRVTAQDAADLRAMAPSCAATGAPLSMQLPVVTPAMPGAGQPSITHVKTYTHAIGAAAKRDSQTGSLPAWDPV